MKRGRTATILDNIIKLIAFAIFSVVAISDASAANPEVPANGYDEDGSGTAGACPAGEMDAVWDGGCDALLPATFADASTNFDRDGDGYGIGGSGYIGDVDCDDTNPHIFPGTYSEVGCSAGEVKECLPSGSYASCVDTDTICDYYVDSGSGSDANPGTKASPWESIGMFSGGATNAPAGAVTPSPGDTLCLVGNTDHTTQFNPSISGIPQIFIFHTVSGTSGNPISIRRLPGHTGKITAATGVFVYTELTDFYAYHNLEVSITDTAGKSAFDFNESDDIEVDRCRVYNTEGDGDDNFGGFFFRIGNRTNVHHSSCHNIDANTGNVENVGCIVNLDDGDTNNSGADHYHYANSCQWDAPGTIGAQGPSCIRRKHGLSGGPDEAGVDGYRIEFNRSLNANNFIHDNASKLRARYNLVVCDPATPFQCRTAYMNKDVYEMEDNRFENNTFVGTESLHWRLNDYTTASQLAWTGNVFESDRFGYVPDEGGIAAIDPYGSGADETQLEAIGALEADDNTYYNPSIPVEFSYFATNRGGALLNFANWKTETGQDAASHEEDPVLNAAFEATSVNSRDRGWLSFHVTGVVPTITAISTSQSSPALSGTMGGLGAGPTVSVTVAGKTYTATNNGDNTWSLSAGQINPGLPVGSHDVDLEVVDGGDTYNDSTTDEVVINYGGWTGSWMRRICPWCY